MDRFPVPTATRDFHQRFDEGHEGTDIFAPDGTTVVAVADGVVRYATEKKGGNAAYLTAKNGRDVYYYGHLRDEKDGTMNVSAGEQIGRVGTSGNAQGRPPHVHFELRRDGEKIDPYPDLYASAHEVDLKLTDATANSPSAANSLPVAAIIALILGSKWLS
jgi:murein DD-endopeptidase MepM/ murein hydrolase activator NlpD